MSVLSRLLEHPLQSWQPIVPVLKSDSVLGEQTRLYLDNGVHVVVETNTLSGQVEIILFNDDGSPMVRKVATAEDFEPHVHDMVVLGLGA